jgi:hypothetical protein
MTTPVCMIFGRRVVFTGATMASTCYSDYSLEEMSNFHDQLLRPGPGAQKNHPSLSFGAGEAD